MGEGKKVIRKRESLRTSKVSADCYVRLAKLYYAIYIAK